MKTRILTTLIILSIAMCSFSQTLTQSLKHRGVVYDVGLRFTPGSSYSVDTFNIDLVKYELSIIANILRANTVRIEGEEIDRLVAATETAHNAGLKVFFNPWKMNVGETETISYMAQAAEAAEKLRQKGVDLVFVAGCEYSMFNQGIFPGNTINERLASLMPPPDCTDLNAHMKTIIEKSKELNRILAGICREVRARFHGPVTYSSGTWEFVDWSLFDIVGVDYYRDRQTDQEYTDGIRRYSEHGKPVVVMEVGCCAYEGAAQRGGSGFTILQGTAPDGTGIYEGGVTPKRSEKEQADYAQTQLELLSTTDVDGVFIYLFSFPVMPHREKGLDNDMTSYAIVKTYAPDD